MHRRNEERDGNEMIGDGRVWSFLRSFLGVSLVEFMWDLDSSIFCIFSKERHYWCPFLIYFLKVTPHG